MTRVMVTGAHPLALGIARGLADRGDDVVVLAPSVAPGAWPEHRTVTCDFASEASTAAAVDAAVATLGGLELVVHAWLAGALFTEAEFATLDEATWVAACEGSFEGAWWLMRHLRAPISASGGGSVVTVVPSIGIAGGAGFAMLATVAEGLRVLAKGCGRQWAQYGITANTVAAAPHHWVDHEAGERLRKAVTLSVPAFGGSGDAAADLAPLVAALGGRDAHFLTAGTVVADGGTWMGL
jgi:3-oxoacyl-[acyl-carrier protein] reductase